MINYPIYNKKPAIFPDDVDRIGVGFPFIHCVYDRVYKWDNVKNEKYKKVDEKGNPVFSFTYHFQK